MELRNKTVVITGGTKGLGMALAVSFLKEKANIVVCSRNQDKLKNLPEGILVIKADVRKESDLNNLMKVNIRTNPCHLCLERNVNGLRPPL